MLVYSVKEEVNENTDKRATQVEVHIDDLDRTHRIGSSRNSNGKARPIIVKFTRYNRRKKYLSITRN